METNLGNRMRTLAAMGHVRAADLCAQADAFDVAAASFYAEPQGITGLQFLRVWRVAYQVWCESSGEPEI